MTDDLDRRIGDWLEDGAQTVPDWVVDQALVRAHATRQLGAGLRVPGVGKRVGLPPLGRVASLAVGAIGALAVIAAFALGFLTAPRIGDTPPLVSPEPTNPVTPRPSALLPRPVRGIEVIDVLPGQSDVVYALIGLAATREAVWTVAVTADPETGDPISRLIRIDASTRAAEPVELPGAAGALSPPVADGETVWTASAGALHAVDASGATGPTTVRVSGLQPREIAVSPEGLWVTEAGGTRLVEPRTGEVLREIAAHSGSRFGRIVGAPMFGSLWECAPGSLLRVDAVSGEVVATIDLPADEATRCRTARHVSEADGVAGALLVAEMNVLINTDANAVGPEFDVGGSWFDVIDVRGQLWFDVAIAAGRGLALVQLDHVTHQPAQSLSVPGAGYSNTTYESGTLAQTDDYVWVLADPTPDAPDGPQIVRLPKTEL